jgi:hypothetical protein
VNNEKRIDSELPTAFELAQLATMTPGLKGTKPRSLTEAVECALELWQEAQRVISSKREAEQQLHELKNGILSMPDDEWNLRLAEYKGQKTDITAMLARTEFPIGDVEKSLFPGKGLHATARHQFFLALPKVAKDHEVPMLGLTVGEYRQEAMAEVLGKPTVNGIRTTINGIHCRWLFLARQKQIAINKTRFIPPSANR